MKLPKIPKKYAFVDNWVETNVVGLRRGDMVRKLSTGLHEKPSMKVFEILDFRAEYEYTWDRFDCWRGDPFAHCDSRHLSRASQELRGATVDFKYRYGNQKLTRFVPLDKTFLKYEGKKRKALHELKPGDLFYLCENTFNLKEGVHVYVSPTCWVSLTHRCKLKLTRWVNPSLQVFPLREIDETTSQKETICGTNIK